MSRCKQVRLDHLTFTNKCLKAVKDSSLMFSLKEVVNTPYETLWWSINKNIQIHVYNKTHRELLKHKGRSQITVAEATTSTCITAEENHIQIYGWAMSYYH